MESATTQEDQREWPSFDDILAELKALDRLARSPLAMDDSAQAEVEVESVEAESDEAELLEVEPVAELPDDLPAVELDTSVLDEPVEVNVPDVAFDPELLEALDPIDQVGDDEVEEPESLEVSATQIDTATVEPETPETESVDDAEAPIAVAEDMWLDDSFDAAAADLDWADDEPGSVFDVAIGTELNTSGFVSEDAPEVEFSDAPEPVAEVEPEPSDAPEDSFSSTDWAQALDAELAPPTIEDVEAEPAEVLTGDFDSVATADAIENELSDLFDLAPDEEHAEVVPLRADFDDTSAVVVGLDDDLGENVESLQAWVGVNEPETESEDPWAYMRPEEEANEKSGFWASRPKFFGGDERKRRKAERQSASPGEEHDSARSVDCPSCGEQGQVDLDDPVGRRVHASCGACDHVWSAAYAEDDAQAS